MQRRGTFGTGAVAMMALVTLACAAPPQGSADIAIRNARVYTVDVDAPWAEAVAIEDGRISYALVGGQEVFNEL